MIKTLPARDLLEQLSEAAWRCADPGVQYDTTINQQYESRLRQFRIAQRKNTIFSV